jgi:hypothetical protein
MGVGVIVGVAVSTGGIGGTVAVARSTDAGDAGEAVGGALTDGGVCVGTGVTTRPHPAIRAATPSKTIPNNCWIPRQRSRKHLSASLSPG